MNKNIQAELLEFIPKLEMLKIAMINIRDNADFPEQIPESSSRPWLYADSVTAQFLISDAVDCIQTAIDDISDITD